MTANSFGLLWLEPLLYFVDEAVYTGTGRRGKSYWMSGRVLRLTLDDRNRVFTAVVQGSATKPYVVTLSQQRGVVVSSCTCPVGMYCKHGVAAALAILDVGQRFEAEWIDEALGVLPMIRKGSRGPVLPEMSPGVPEYISGDTSSDALAVLEASKARKGARVGKRTAPAVPWWEEYLKAETSDDRYAAIARGIRGRLVVSPHSWMASDIVTRLLREENPFSTVRDFDRIVESFAARMRLQTRPRDIALEEFLRRPATLELAAQSERKLAQDQLLRWLEQSESAHLGENLSYVELLWFPVSTPGGIARLHFQLLLTSKKLYRSPRHPQAIEQLEKDIQSGQRQFSYDDQRIIRWIIRHNCFGPLFYTNNSTAADPAKSVSLPVCGVLEWLSMWADSACVAWQSGEALKYDLRPAKLRLFAGAGAAPVWSISFPNDTDDLPTPIGAVDLLADYGPGNEPKGEPVILARRDGTLYRVENAGMPFAVFEGLLRAPEAPIDRLRESRSGAILASRLLGLSPNGYSQSIVETVPVRPIVECRLDEASTLSFAAKAITENGVTFYWTRSATWEQLESLNSDQSEGAMQEMALETEESNTAIGPVSIAGQTASPYAIAVAPRAHDVARLEEWMRQTVPTFAKPKATGAGTPSCEWQLRGGEILNFLRNWATRPPGVTYLGNRAFQTFVALRRPPRVTVRIEPSGMDWLRVSVEMEKDIESLSLSEVISALKVSEDELVTLSGWRNFRREELEDYYRQMQTLNDLGLDAGAGPQEVHALQLAGAPIEILNDMGPSSGDVDELLSSARKVVASFKGIPKATVPLKTAKFLRPYQRTGVDFLVWAARTFGGALLADDMGLGKTLQVLAALTALRKSHRDNRPSLVVCPASVAHNWQREAGRFTPSLRVVVIERGAERHAILKRLADYDLVVKNYALTRRDAEVLRAQEWFMVCVDEAQAIKNADADISRTVKTLSAQYRFALTGTPIENRLADLWSIMDFAVPGHLAPLKRFEQRAKGLDGESSGGVLRARLRPVVLRRLKVDVAPELPPRIEERRDCAMTPAQRKVYLAEVQRTRLLLDGLKTKQVVGKERIQILAALTRLRQLCCDPALVNFPDTGSGKTNELMDLLPPLLEGGQKVLLFSQFVRMLKRLETSLHERRVPTYMLTGETTKRQALVDRFEGDKEPSVFLISLKAGGTGLNLVSASHVILFDPWWNPAVEAQAIDRTHRIGQDKTVVAFRLVALGTVEERIIELQERKRDIVKDVLEEGAFNRSLTREDFEFILGDGA